MDSSRKYRIAIAVLGIASLVMIALVVKNFGNIPALMPLLWWWATISSGVLTLYGAANVIQKGITKPPGGNGQ